MIALFCMCLVVPKQESSAVGNQEPQHQHLPEPPSWNPTAAQEVRIFCTSGLVLICKINKDIGKHSTFTIIHSGSLGWERFLFLSPGLLLEVFVWRYKKMLDSHHAG